MKALVKTLWLVFLISFLGSAGSRAGWIENGVPLTRQGSTAAGGGVIVSDGSSGAIIAYPVCRNGVGHIIAQRVNSLGVALWGEAGVELCTATRDQNSPAIISDGAGGAIITWQDYRNGDHDIYAQRVNASGDVQWTTGGVAICLASRDQSCPAITSDGAGGAIVAWQDYHSGAYQIHAQRVNPSGAVQWTANGVVLCPATVGQQYPAITSDGAGGAIVTWDDHRSGNTWFYAIYVQRVNASGAIQWATDGIALCGATVETSDQQYPAITSDAAGGAIVIWARGAHLYGQRLNASGAVQWTVNGVALCAQTGSQRYPASTSDGTGGAIVTWWDLRTSGVYAYYSTYAQRVDASGAVQWNSDGVRLCGAKISVGAASQIVSDGAGGAIVTSVDDPNGTDNIYTQKVNASGEVQWTADGVAIRASNWAERLPALVSDGTGGAIVAWEDSRGGIASAIYSQRVNASGALQWATDGVALGAATGDQEYQAIASDGAGDAIVAWKDYRSRYGDIYAQKLNASGAIQWGTDGVAICTATGAQDAPTIVSDGAGGAIVAWQDSRNGINHIYAQRVNASGSVQWTTDGVHIGPGTGPQIASDGAGGAIVAWEDSRSGIGADIYAQRVNASGLVQWASDGVALCAQTGNHYDGMIVSDGVGGAIVTWSYDDNHVYAQRVNALGVVQWTINGVALCTATGLQWSPRIASDVTGGAIITWLDMRSGGNHIYIQRVNASGAVQWATDGVPLCTASAGKPGIASDGVGGAIVTWNDYRSGNDNIYAQRVNASGAIQWMTNGVPLCTATGDQTDPAIASDGASGAIVTWYDQRSGKYDIYVQRVNASGAVQWTVDGVALCRTTGDHIYDAITSIVSDVTGGAIVAWVDGRCSPHIYAQRVDAAGHIAPEIATLLQNYAAALDGASIRINWVLAEIDTGVRFSILRASAPDWNYIELKGAPITQDGLSFALTDTGCLPGATYKYRVEYEIDGTSPKILFETDAIAMPAIPVTLYQNHPNPFNPQTVIRFYLPETQEIFLDVYNVAGERVARLAEGRTEKGYHEVVWDGRSSSGTVCSSGVYFSRLKAGKNAISRKMVIVR